MDKWHQGGNFTFIGGLLAEVGEYKFLEGFNLILEFHKVCDSFIPKRSRQRAVRHSILVIIPLIRIIDSFQTNVLLIFKGTLPSSVSTTRRCNRGGRFVGTVEFGVLSMKKQLRK